ncbi:unnamed protein product, partial [Leptidea sinapis]
RFSFEGGHDNVLSNKYDKIHSVYYVFSFCFLLLRCLLTSLLAVRVNTEAKKPHQALLNVQRFQRQIQYLPVAISGVFFKVTKAMILQVDKPLRGRPQAPNTEELQILEAENRKRGRSKEEEFVAPQGVLPPKVARFAQRVIVAEEEIEDLLQKIRAPVEGDSDSHSPSSLKERMTYAVAVINKVATKSTNLKGPFVRALKDSSATISSVVDALVEDVVRLRAANERLTEQVADLSAQFAHFRSGARSEQPKSAPEQTAPSPAPSDAHLRQVIDAV